ncbi:cob(I)yrinic acid a,c-diamide adenosyltransferase [Alkalicoccobacillus murimartini]|uniref:Corrinoid adenosyltransferase n=1 Tax=Alkalicoccobacillus murimartini TaxID=171685 RepID=A0ABT9YDD2_9BACI|nr:cob(I)yrinic acid a,c-diamide adenosyltransferase [Alkalicoccobacillus murimartini]MDQ0205867.1 cob(I)alamin adenosyltransferase [Alkalicoccobacillus murimartini]
MKIYTKQGDQGKTSIVGGKVNKHDIRVEVLGTLDELNCQVGLARAELAGVNGQLNEELLKIQHELFDCGSDLSSIRTNESKEYKVNAEMITWLEKRIDEWVDVTPPIKRFILPGGTKGAATLHVCRSVARRAERKISLLHEEKGDVPQSVQAYVNRLSDYFFAVARAANHLAQTNDVEYIRGTDVFTFGNSEENKKG